MRRADWPPNRPVVKPLVGMSQTGVITLGDPRRPEDNRLVTLVYETEDERAYRGLMAIVRRSFLGWAPAWRDFDGLPWWSARIRELLPGPVPPSISADVGAPPLPSASAPEPESVRELPPGAVVYFIRMGNLIKIGHTANLARRVHGLSVTLNQVLATEAGDREREAALHRQFAHLREFGEWFRAEPELLAHIENLQARSAA